jgi:integrase
MAGAILVKGRITMAKSTSARRPRKPEKPHADYPLFPHPNGLWAKKIRGRVWYFGSWKEDRQGVNALAKYLEEKDSIFAGRDPRQVKPAGCTVAELCNRFLTAKGKALEQGLLRTRHFADLHDACKRLVEACGDRLVEDIGPVDFESLKNCYPTNWRLRRRKREITAVRSVFNHALKLEIITRTRFGDFKQPTPRQLADERFSQERKTGNREFAPEQLRMIIDAAPAILKAMILLGVNCGLGNSDLSEITESYLDLDKRWCEFPRVKTSIPRRSYLWPETVSAIREAMAMRPKPRNPEDGRLLFITATGLRYVRIAMDKDDTGNVVVKADDAISKAFRMLLKKLKISRRGLSFYSLRHCTETHGGADQIAVDVIMGHASRGMGTNYRQSIADERLKAVSASIHLWLFGKPLE